MAFIIRRTDQGGGYVAPSGNGGSYARNPAKARKFSSFASAQADCCPGNEVVMEYHDASLKPCHY